MEKDVPPAYMAGMDGDDAVAAGPIFRPEAVAAYAAGQTDDAVLATVSPQTVIALVTFVALVAGLGSWLWFGTLALAVSGRGTIAEPNALEHEVAPYDGVIERDDVTAGDTVAAGDRLGYLRAPDGALVALRAHAPGVVANALPATGTFLKRGDPIADLTPAGTPQRAVVFIPADEARVTPGARARVRIGGLLETPLSAHVIAVDPWPASAGRVHAFAPTAYGEPSAVREVDLALDESSAGVIRGAPVTATIVVGGRAPIKAFFSSDAVRDR